jgi:hypothetical protein
VINLPRRLKRSRIEEGNRKIQKILSINALITNKPIFLQILILIVVFIFNILYYF